MTEVQIEQAITEILERGLDDWVQVAEASEIVRGVVYGERLLDRFPAEGQGVDQESLVELRERWLAEQERETFPQLIATVKELVRSGLADIGELGDAPGFTPWEGTLPELEARIDSVARGARFPLFIESPMLFWLRNTTAGNQRVQQSS